MFDEHSAKVGAIEINVDTSRLLVALLDLFKLLLQFVQLGLVLLSRCDTRLLDLVDTLALFFDQISCFLLLLSSLFEPGIALFLFFLELLGLFLGLLLSLFLGALEPALAVGLEFLCPLLRMLLLLFGMLLRLLAVLLGLFSLALGCLLIQNLLPALALLRQELLLSDLLILAQLLLFLLLLELSLDQVLHRFGLLELEVHRLLLGLIGVLLGVRVQVFLVLLIAT